MIYPLIASVHSRSASFNRMLHFCRYDNARYTTSVGALGNFCSIDILFLVVQSAQANPAKTNIINFFGKGPLPMSHTSESSFRHLGLEFHLKTSPQIPQANLASTQWKNIWSIVSQVLHTQHLPFPFHPRLIRVLPTCNLLKTRHRKKLIFVGTLDFQITPAILLGNPLSDKNL